MVSLAWKILTDSYNSDVELIENSTSLVLPASIRTTPSGIMLIFRIGAS